MLANAPFIMAGLKYGRILSRDLREITNAMVFKRRLINELIHNMSDL